MSVEHMPDERLTAFYENIRQQVEADQVHKHQLTTGPTVREYADKLRSELIKRRLKHSLFSGRLSRAGSRFNAQCRYQC